MKQQSINEVLFQTEDALIHDVYPGFKDDYLCIHSLLRRYNPKTILEIGTNIGSGVNVMARSLPNAKIYSLDLDYETMRLISKQYPISENGEDGVGSSAIYPYTQLRGDSMTFNYHSINADAWYIDGEHDYNHVYHESISAINCGATLIIWHDSDMPPVWMAINDAINKNYDLFRITNTRISYAVKH